MIINFCEEKKIKYCSAAFEADWQLVSLQQQGLIKHIISSDGNLFVLGWGEIVLSPTSTTLLAHVVCMTETALCSVKVWEGGVFSKEDLPLLSCLAGNDYIDHLYGNGHKRVLQLMQQFICLETQEDKQAFISELERRRIE